jgi:hypothetical protein
MITDFQATLASAQAVTTTAPTTNAYDTGSVYDSNRGEVFGVLFTVDVAADFTTGDETYSFSVETDNDSAFGSATVLSSKAVLTPLLTAGDKVWLPVGLGVEQYVRGRVTTAGTTPTITITAEWKPACDVATETSNLPTGYSIT